MSTLKQIQDEYHLTTEADLRDFASEITFDTEQLIIEKHQYIELVRFPGVITPNRFGEELCEFTLSMSLDDHGQNVHTDIDFLDVLPSASSEVTIRPEETYAKRIIIAELENPSDTVVLKDQNDNAVTMESLEDLAELAWMKNHGYGEEREKVDQALLEEIIKARAKDPEVLRDVIRQMFEQWEKEPTTESKQGRLRSRR